MDKVLKDKWVAALRSGGYEQGRYQLRSKNNKFCCLGVLCDIVNPEDWVESALEFTYQGSALEFTYQGSAFLLSPILQVELGFDQDKPVGEKKLPLAILNDTELSFREIADIIEKEL